MVTVDELNRNPDVSADVVTANEGLNAPVYATESDLPSASNQTEGAQAYVQSTESFYVVVDN